MRRPFSIISPIRDWNLGEVELVDGVRVVKAPSQEELDLSFFPSLSRRELERIHEREYWLAYECEEPQTEAELEAEKDRVRRCAYGLQIVRPTGWDGILVKRQGHAGAWRTYGLEQPPSCEPTRWAHTAGFGTHGLKDIRTIIAGVNRAFAEKIVRFQTPIQLLIEGLKGRNFVVQMLLWCIALDALLVAEKEVVFERRLIGFLGADTFIFPFGERGHQPPYTVAELAGELYKLRNIIAHGYEMPRRYQEKVGFDIVATVCPAANMKWPYQRRQLLSEASLFLLCAVLRWIFEKDLIDLVKKSKRWKNYLDGLGAQA